MRLILLLIFFFHGYVYSADYTYKIVSNGTHVASSASEVCDIFAQTTLSSYPNRTMVKRVWKDTQPERYKCGITYTPEPPYGEQVTDILREGSSCPDGGTLNVSGGYCELPPPECKVGDLFPAKGDDGTVVSSSGRNYVAGSDVPVACYNQCTYSDPSARPSSCYGTVGGVGWCNYVIKSTGENCSADSYTFAKSGPSLNSPDTPDVPDSTVNDPQCPKGWGVSNGTCFKKPPEFCDPSTGAVCAPGTTDPDATPPDPGTGGTPGTPSEGAEGNPDTSSGADDDLQKLEESKNDGEACKPNADGTGCSGSTVKGEQCDKVIECTGDAVQCATLRQQKKMACAYEYKDARPFIEQQIAKDAYKLGSSQVNGTSLFQDGLGAPRWLSAGCPAPKAISVKGVSTSLSFEPACNFASSLGPLFVALAGIFFAVYVGRAFGGS